MNAASSFTPPPVRIYSNAHAQVAKINIKTTQKVTRAHTELGRERRSLYLTAREQIELSAQRSPGNARRRFYSACKKGWTPPS